MEQQKQLVNNTYNPIDNKHFEGAFTQGNGYLNARASFEEDIPGESQQEKYWRLPANVTLEQIRNPISKWGIYVPGIYGVHPILGEEIVNLPYLLGINLYIGKEHFNMDQSCYFGYLRTLNLKNGVLERSLTWETSEGNISIRWQRYLSMHHTHLIVQQLELYADKDMKIVVESFLDGNVTTNGYQHLTKLTSGIEDGLEYYLQCDSGQFVGMKSKCSITTSEEFHRETSEHNNRLSERITINLKKHEKTTIQKHGFVVTSIDDDFSLEIQDRMKQLEQTIAQEPLSLEVHKQIWADLWDKSEVLVEGDDKLQECLDFSIYHLLRAANHSSTVAIDAKGYAGEAYFGHYFWDTEIYLLPFYSYTQPKQAQNLVKFRYYTLEGAKKNARIHGYKGAKYPWEVCASGLEQCSNWQYADLEIHVTADVVFGIWQYCHITKDTDFLMREGLAIMVETARYWLDRVVKKEDGYHLLGVMGPDEYLPFTNDNAYTNYLVSFALAKTLEVIHMAQPSAKEHLHLNEEEIQAFKEVQEGLVFSLDENQKIILQCEGFEKFEDVDFDSIWKDRTKPFGNSISQERNYRSKALKQADVVALLYLFRDNFTKEIKKNCMDYYEKLTTHDSSLSYIIHSLLYGDMGDLEKSYEYVEKSMGIDWGSKGCAEGIHIANAGGLWQGVVTGFGGLNGWDEQGQPIITPRLPKHIRKITYKVCIGGIWHEIKCENK